jgi:hypothetical protein
MLLVYLCLEICQDAGVLKFDIIGKAGEVIFCCGFGGMAQGFFDEGGWNASSFRTILIRCAGRYK